jgi:hypothetical protein
MGKLLGIYLNDHLAGSYVGEELAKRCKGSNEGTAVGDYLGHFLEELRRDRDSLISVMEANGVARNPLKPIGAWAAEKMGRLKLNGQITGYSPLSRLTELEGLIGGVNLKVGGWRSLKAAGVTGPVDYDELIARGEAQHDQLERLRIDAATRALPE